MKRELNLGQALSMAITLIIAGVTGWVSLNNKVSTQEANVKNLEIRMTSYEIRQAAENAEIKKALQEISSTVIDIRLSLKDKADRK